MARSWREDRQQKERRLKEQEAQNLERVILTEDNIKIVAKRTGRSEYELRKILDEVEAQGGTASIRIPQKGE